jgi:predicted RNA-binding protein YlxR (DUF448 family)
MRSIQRRFKKIQEKDRGLGSYIALSRAVKQQKFSKNIIARWFNKLVNKSEYEQGDKKKLISHLWKISNDTEENQLMTTSGALSED